MDEHPGSYLTLYTGSAYENVEKQVSVHNYLSKSAPMNSL